MKNCNCEDTYSPVCVTYLSNNNLTLPRRDQTFTYSQDHKNMKDTEEEELGTRKITFFSACHAGCQTKLSEKLNVSAKQFDLV